MLECDILTHDLQALARLDNYHRWILEEIRPYLGNRLVEIGAGIGTMTALLVRDYLTHAPAARLEAFEPTGHLYHQLRESLGRSHPDFIRAGRLLLTEGYFQASPDTCDTVVMINVLEHIADDRAIIRMALESLSPGGTLVIYSPALQWLYSPHDKAVGHHRRYEKTHLEELVLGQGFAAVKVKYMDCMGVLPWFFLNVIGGSTSTNPRLARLYDTWFIPVTRRVEDFWAPWLGKNILLVARKHAPGVS